MTENPRVAGSIPAPGTSSPRADIGPPGCKSWGVFRFFGADAGVTDQDGWYMIPYKHTGRLATYKLQVDTNRNGAWNDSGDLLLDVPLKANAYTERNFQLP